MEGLRGEPGKAGEIGFNVSTLQLFSPHKFRVQRANTFTRDCFQLAVSFPGRVRDSGASWCSQSASRTLFGLDPQWFIFKGTLQSSRYTRCSLIVFSLDVKNTLYFYGFIHDPRSRRTDSKRQSSVIIYPTVVYCKHYILFFRVNY